MWISGKSVVSKAGFGMWTDRRVLLSPGGSGELGFASLSKVKRSFAISPVNGPTAVIELVSNNSTGGDSGWGPESCHFRPSPTRPAVEAPFHPLQSNTSVRVRKRRRGQLRKDTNTQNTVSHRLFFFALSTIVLISLPFSGLCSSWCSFPLLASFPSLISLSFLLSFFFIIEHLFSAIDTRKGMEKKEETRERATLRDAPGQSLSGVFSYLPSWLTPGFFCETSKSEFPAWHCRETSWGGEKGTRKGGVGGGAGENAAIFIVSLSSSHSLVPPCSLHCSKASSWHLLSVKRSSHHSEAHIKA